MAAIVTVIIVIALVVILVWFLWNVYKLVVTLLKAYISVILLLIFAPVIILFGALTPRGGFGTWLKMVISNLAVFPTVGFMFIIATWLCIMSTVMLQVQITQFYPAFGSLPPVVGNLWSPPLVPSGDEMLGLILALGSFVVFANIHKAADIISSLLSGQPFNYGTALKQQISAPTSVADMYTAVSLPKTKAAYDTAPNPRNIFNYQVDRAIDTVTNIFKRV